MSCKTKPVIFISLRSFWQPIKAEAVLNDPAHCGWHKDAKMGANRFEEYQRRFPKEMSLELIEIPAVKRGKSADIKRTLKEGEQMLAAIAKRTHIVNLEVDGKPWDTPTLPSS